jgi:hypothetical protein
MFLYHNFTLIFFPKRDGRAKNKNGTLEKMDGYGNSW